MTEIERKLRAVKASEKAPAKRAPLRAEPMSVAAATRTGDPRKMLVALRYRIAKAIDDPNIGGPALAALLRQQMEIASRIEVIDHAAQAAKGRPGQPESVVATTPDEAWDESMI